MVGSPAQASWSKYGYPTPSMSIRRPSRSGSWSCGNAAVGVIGHTTASNSAKNRRQSWRWSSRRLSASIQSRWLNTMARVRAASRLWSSAPSASARARSRSYPSIGKRATEPENSSRA